ncbi:MAG: TRAP transporter substrate-binding protein DctP [Deltaproteobacteria bacterium]|nr:TRAP transporter substrate-binding protein DctP [Deltaproteobacteria bacterium]
MKRRKHFRFELYIALFSAILLVLGATSPGAAADKHTINCIAGFAKSTQVTTFFIKDFIGSIQKAADQKYPGQLKMVFKGGPELVPINEQIVALEKGMIDLMYSAPGFYVSKMPELDMMNLTPLKPWEEKAVGLYDYLDQLHNQKVNAHFLVRNGIGRGFQFGLTKPVNKLDDFKGMGIRGNPTTVQIVKTLGANPVSMGPGDVYTALERGVVQAHITPPIMLRVLGLVKVTKYLLFPQFFDTPNVLLVNLNTWKKLPKHLQDLVTEQADMHSRKFVAYNADLEKNELEFYKSQGMKFIDLPKPEADKLLKLTYDTMVQVVMEKAPNEGKKILEYYQKKP